VQIAVLRLHGVCPSVTVTLVDQDLIGWKSWKLITRTISPTPSLFVAQTTSTYYQGNMGKFGRDKRWGRKSGVLEHKSGNRGPISETRKDRGKVTMDWRAYYRCSFERYHPRSNTPPFPQERGSQPQPKAAIAIISGSSKAAHCKFGRYIQRVHPNKCPWIIWDRAWVYLGTVQIFWVTPIISGMGKATNFKFCTHVRRIDRNKRSLKISAKVAVGVLRNSRTFSGHPYIGRIVRSSLR